VAARPVRKGLGEESVESTFHVVSPAPPSSLDEWLMRAGPAGNPSGGQPPGSRGSRPGGCRSARITPRRLPLFPACGQHGGCAAANAGHLPL
jgi:hypothetical protein